jgi:hypothetical protein
MCWLLMTCQERGEEEEKMMKRSRSQSLAVMVSIEERKQHNLHENCLLDHK